MQVGYVYEFHGQYLFLTSMPRSISPQFQSESPLIEQFIFEGN